MKIIRALPRKTEAITDGKTVRVSFEPGDVVIVSDFAGDPEIIGVKAAFVGMSEDGRYLAKFLQDGEYIKKTPVPWKYCFHLSELEVEELR